MKPNREDLYAEEFRVKIFGSNHRIRVIAFKHVKRNGKTEYWHLDEFTRHSVSIAGDIRPLSRKAGDRSILQKRQIWTTSKESQNSKPHGN
ncbi:MAG: hypothetical protein ACRDF4_09005 [Rhabdochlamydiaceae bacterium]